MVGGFCSRSCFEEAEVDDFVDTCCFGCVNDVLCSSYMDVEVGLVPFFTVDAGGVDYGVASLEGLGEVLDIVDVVSVGAGDDDSVFWWECVDVVFADESCSTGDCDFSHTVSLCPGYGVGIGFWRGGL